mmetsp:Transcript_26968/g.39941  ORF Transcript_26968/g.39941 Transcript_26968/m.39941 type:complete len:215 (+) Transcript_26968:76-720(+)
MPPEENESLIETSNHKIPIESLYSILQSSPNGMEMTQRRIRRELDDMNVIPPPLKCPAWLCCILPCLLKTKDMQYFNECSAEYAEVKIDNKWVKIDPVGVLTGDVVRVTEGNRVPADLRVISVIGEECKFVPTCITGTSTPRSCRPELFTNSYRNSPNMAFAGFMCTEGECIGIVIATGRNTLLGRMIEMNEWPPALVDDSAVHERDIRLNSFV